MSLVDLLRASTERHPDRPALTDVATGRTLGYGALLAEAEAVAATLRAAGVRAPQRIALVGAGAFGYIGVAFGILATGGCLVPIASTLRAAERDEITAGLAVHGMVTLPDDGGPWSFAWIDRTRASPDGFGALDPAFIRFSSGTTADAKGVVLSHATTRARIAAADAVLRLTPDDRVLWTLPLAYHFAVTIPAYLGAGAHILLCPESQPARMATALATERATVVYASPLQLERLAAAAQPAPALRLVLSTAAPLGPVTAARVADALGRPIGQAYGIIEAGLPCINRGDDPAVPVASVGRAVAGYTVSVVAPDGRTVAAGEHGEVAVRGPGLFDAYFAPWRLRTDVLRDGWFPTGDVGSLDPTGVLTLHGRLKSTIVVGGMKLFPEEVEAVLVTAPGILEARVVGRAHPRLGELPHAEVVLRPDATFDRDALAAHCARRLSPWKVPVDFTVVGAIAKTASGKILRR